MLTLAVSPEAGRRGSMSHKVSSVAAFASTRVPVREASTHVREGEMRDYLPALAVIAAALTIPVSAANAIPITFTAVLSGANEVPAVPSPGTGLATVILDAAAQTLQINVTFSGLSSNVTAAHIHCCAPLGANVGVATTIPAFPGFPTGGTSGTYTSAVFDLTQPLIYNT